MRIDVLTIASAAVVAAVPAQNERRQFGLGAGVNILHLGLSGQCGLQLGLGLQGNVGFGGGGGQRCQQLQQNYAVKGESAFDPREFGEGFRAAMDQAQPTTDAEPTADADEQLERRYIFKPLGPWDPRAWQPQGFDAGSSHFHPLTAAGGMTEESGFHPLTAAGGMTEDSGTPSDDSHHIEKRQFNIGGGVSLLNLGLDGQCGLSLGLGPQANLGFGFGQQPRRCQQLQRDYAVKGNKAFDPEVFGKAYKAGMDQAAAQNQQQIQKRQFNIGGGISLLNLGLNRQCGLSLGLGPQANLGFGFGQPQRQCQQLQRNYAIKGDDAFDPVEFGKAYQEGMDRAAAQNEKHVEKRQFNLGGGVSLLGLGLNRECGLQLGVGPSASIGFGQQSTPQCKRLTRRYAVENNLPHVGEIEVPEGTPVEKRQIGATGGISLLQLGLNRQCGLQVGAGPQASVGFGQQSTPQCQQLTRDYAVKHNMPHVGEIPDQEVLQGLHEAGRTSSAA